MSGRCSGGASVYPTCREVAQAMASPVADDTRWLIATQRRLGFPICDVERQRLFALDREYQGGSMRTLGRFVPKPRGAMHRRPFKEQMAQCNECRYHRHPQGPAAFVADAVRYLEKFHCTRLGTGALMPVNLPEARQNQPQCPSRAVSQTASPIDCGFGESDMCMTSMHHQHGRV